MVLVCILAAFVLPEDYKDSGVFNGNFHAINRAFVLILCVGVVTVCVRIGNKIKDQLAKGASKVVPDPGTDKKKAPTDADKIGQMASGVKKVMVVVILYLVYDIAISVGKYRHITPSFCEAKNVFVRLPTFVQFFAIASITYVFPLKKPEDAKYKAAMLKQTVVSSSQ